ncbi:hypothetical protein MNV49_001745 [Pseudohyphozyma bogoriensis]|nr:hypothetical protein MNV49_001745 [Pseudohyphozyma bogoriensis]
MSKVAETLPIPPQPYAVESPLATPQSGTPPPVSVPAGHPPVLAGGEDDEQLGLAARLRLATGKAHHEVMQPKVVSKLVAGTLPQQIHTAYLYRLYQIYTALEDSLSSPFHASATTPSDPLLPISDPALLARAESLESDISWYLGVSGEQHWGADWKKALRKADEKGNKLGEYVRRMEQLGGIEGGHHHHHHGATKKHEDVPEKDGRHRLVAHAYVRYLGDLSGGQTVARNLRKSYDLPSTGEGTAFYEFFLPADSPYRPSSSTATTTGLPVPANVNEVKAIKNWFREGLDEIGKILTEEERQGVIDEARWAFEMNIGVFLELQAMLDEYEKEGGAEEKSAGAEEVKRRAKEGVDGTWVGVLGEGGRKKESWWTIAGVGIGVALFAWVVRRDLFIQW